MEEKKQSGWSNLNGISDDDKTCGLNDMNCLGENDDSSCGLNDMNLSLIHISEPTRPY